MLIYEIMESENPEVFEDGIFKGILSQRIEITDTDTNQMKVCEKFTWLDNDDQATLKYVYDYLCNWKKKC